MDSTTQYAIKSIVRHYGIAQDAGSKTTVFASAELWPNLRRNRQHVGERCSQRSLFEAEHLYLYHVRRHSFYGFLALMRNQLFQDKKFAELYCSNDGRDSLLPSLLATALLLQTHDKVGDDEAKRRDDFDIRWKVVLCIGIDERPFAKSTLQLFRAHLTLHDKA